MKNESQTVRPGSRDTDVTIDDAQTIVPVPSDLECTRFSLAGYLESIGCIGGRMPAHSSVDQWYAVSNLYDTL